ncbi:MAG: diadenylate cyclase CdaA [Bacteroidaceae bacterium]|nr:diadenylate cyclase CdaA [Bacteroidaceae bacterium]
MLTFDFKDALDILCVAFMLFYLYRLLKSTRAAGVFKGIMVFVFVWIVVSRILNMRLMGGIMDQLVNIGVIALVVLFQEEIRHFFSNIGTQRGLNWLLSYFRDKSGDTQQANPDIMPLVRACVSMAKQKTGALIVIERGVGLKDEAQTGDPIDAAISSRLIENIFFKNSPLHDGALIISNHRLQAAACILPVSHNPAIPKNFGLRHRSGVGITEKSDALAIIVSEESGNISVAEQGRLTHSVTGEQLESLLQDKWA